MVGWLLPVFYVCALMVILLDMMFISACVSRWRMVSRVLPGRSRASVMRVWFPMAEM